MLFTNTFNQNNCKIKGNGAERGIMKQHQFVEELIGKMTLDEKIVQVSCMMPIRVTWGQGIQEEKLQEACPEGVGRMTQFANSFLDGPRAVAKAYNDIQKYHVEKTRLGIPVLIQNESAVGLNAADATIFPSPIGMAATFEPKMVEEAGRIIGEQARAVGIRKCLSPVADVARDSRWGRMGETFGEDPTVVTSFSVAESKGLQGEFYGDHVISCAKHFMGYGASEAGNNCAAINLGKKELREVYGVPFAAMIHENDLQSVMVTYSEIDGLPMSINDEYINGYLREELGFTGSAICDGQSIPWVHHTNGIGKSPEDIACRAARVGIDADTPMTEYYMTLKTAIEEGRLEEEILDNLVRRVLNQKYELGLFENPYVETEKAAEVFQKPEGNELSKRMSEKLMTLLKNEKQFLPLKDNYRKIGLIGPFADAVSTIFGGYAYPSHLQTLFSAVYNEANSMNGGFGGFYQMCMDLKKMHEEMEIDDSLSCEENLERYLRRRFGFTSVYDEMKKTFVNTEVSCSYGIGNEVETIELAKEQDVLVLCLGEVTGFGGNATSGEGKNNPNLTLPGRQEELIREMARLKKPMVLVLFNGRGLEITGVEGYFDAILESWYAGPYGPSSIAKVLHGDINPGGKLAVTFPRWSAQCPIYYGFHTGGGYHNISKAKGIAGSGFNATMMPLYCFGHGLSYTEFAYSDLKVSKTVGVDGVVEIDVSVKNVGETAGDEVVQVYFRTLTPSVNRPFRELRAFKRISLKEKEEKTLHFIIPVHALAYYNEEFRFVVEPADLEVYVGSSSEDIRLTDSFQIVGETKDVLYEREFLFTATEK